MRAIHPRALSVALGAILGGVLLSGCVQHHHHTRPQKAVVVQKKGPPPWAPAHGYRHKHESGVELVFDSGLGVYVVLGHDGYYFHKDRFYHYTDGKWFRSVSFTTSWGAVRIDDVPARLRVKHVKKSKKKGKGNFPAKHRR
jgi:hypothetical protein